MASTVKQKIAQNGLRKLWKAIKTQQTHNRRGFSNSILILMYFRQKTADYFRSNFSSVQTLILRFGYLSFLKLLWDISKAYFDVHNFEISSCFFFFDKYLRFLSQRSVLRCIIVAFFKGFVYVWVNVDGVFGEMKKFKTVYPRGKPCRNCRVVKRTCCPPFSIVRV